MLTGTENQSLYQEYYDTVQAIEAKQALNYLIGWAATLNSHDCTPGNHGLIKDFRFMRGSNWDFSFIPNQKWLLFYFRKPSLNLEKFSKNNILAQFPSATENNAGEITIRISTLEIAVKLAEFIGN